MAHGDSSLGDRASDMTEHVLARLKFGSGPWNVWRREHPDVAVILDGADLNGMILTGIDFSRVSLRGASMHATNLMNADLRQADMTGANLAEADLIAAKLGGAILTRANLHEADLLGADLTDTQYSVRTSFSAIAAVNRDRAPSGSQNDEMRLPSASKVSTVPSFLRLSPTRAGSPTATICIR